MLDLVLSTIAFFVASFFINRYLNEQGINKGMARGILVFVLASVVSFITSSTVDWIDAEAQGGTKNLANAAPLHSDEFSQLVKSLNAVQEH